jgi:hypothetical protein
MGLDIYVYKPTPLGNRKPKAVEYAWTLEVESELMKRFGHMTFQKTNRYYDIEGAIQALNLNPVDLISGGYRISSTVQFTYVNTKHELFEAYNFLQGNWNLYSDTKAEFVASDVYKTFKEKYCDLLVKHGWRKSYKFYARGSKTTHYNLVDANRFAQRKVGVIVRNPKTLPRVDTCLDCVEVGYQRKGANQRFYEDDMWSSEPIFDMATLLEHWEKYFSSPTPDSKGGWGSGTEYDLEAAEMRKRFKENIVDKFVEGETFVYYS